MLLLLQLYLIALDFPFTLDDDIVLVVVAVVVLAAITAVAGSTLLLACRLVIMMLLCCYWWGYFFVYLYNIQNDDALAGSWSAKKNRRLKKRKCWVQRKKNVKWEKNIEICWRVYCCICRIFWRLIDQRLDEKITGIC